MLKNVSYVYDLFNEPLEKQALNQGYRLHNPELLNYLNNAIFYIKVFALITDEEFQNIIERFNNLVLAHTQEL